MGNPVYHKAVNQPYLRLSPYLKQRFGNQPVRRITLDAGSTCPNRDGTKGRGGCVYCDVDGSGNGFLRSGIQIADQFRRGLNWFRQQIPNTKAIAYFQSYSNTYVSMERLRESLAALEPFREDIAVLSVATRPDTFPQEAAQILAAQQKYYPVWVEFGLESADDETLKNINRLHTLQEYIEAVARAKQYQLEVITHVILGLPGETAAHFRKTAQAVCATTPHGVKIHQLMVLKKTILARWYQEGRVELFSWKEYLQHVADFIERIPAEIVIHRIMGEAKPEELIAPQWPIAKNKFRDQLLAEFQRRNSSQGSSARRSASAGELKGGRVG